jgi:hypothetical protein
MVSVAGVLREPLAELVALNSTADQVTARILAVAREVDAADTEGVVLVWEAAQVIGRAEQARHGQLVQVLAHADRAGSRKGVLKPWIATRLDVSDSKARGIAEAASRIGAVPELAQALSSGRVGRGHGTRADPDRESGRGQLAGQDCRADRDAGDLEA